MTRALVLSALVLAGCGWKTKALDLELVRDRQAADLAATQSALTDARAAIAELEARVGELDTALADLTAARDALAADKAELEGALAEEQEKAARILADRGALRAEIRAMTEAMEELRARKAAAEARVQSYKDLVARFQSLIDAGTLDVRIVDGRMVVVLQNDILFASGSADLSEDGRAALAQVAEVLAGIDERRFQVEGHTDDVPIKTSRFPSNWYLSAARAIGVVDTLVGAGMAPDAVSAAAFADTRPVAPNDTDEGRAQNRRIEIVVVPDLSDLPGYDELSGM